MAGLIQDTELFGEYIPWFAALREKGLAAFKQHGMPTAKTEAWKYTKPRDLNADDFEMEASNFLDEIKAVSEETCGCHHENGECSCGGHHDAGCHCGHHHKDCHCGHHHKDCHCGHREEIDIEDEPSGHASAAGTAGSCRCSCGSCEEEASRFPGSENEPSDDASAAGCAELNLNYNIPFDAYQIHFVNGKFIPIFPALPKGVEVITLMEAVLIEEAKAYLGKLLDLDSHPFGALNTAYMEEGIYIRVHKGVKLDKPLMIINHTNAGERNLFYNLRNLVILENGAEAEILEWYKYAGAPKSRYFANIVNEIFISPEAKLNHYKLQNEAFKANHLSLTVAKLKTGAEYNNFCLQKGANIGRNEVKVLLGDEQARTNVDAAYIMSGWATLDTTTDIEHLAADTYSDQLVKGVVSGDARGVFQGKIHIAPDAVKTEGHQLHRALLLSDTAEIDVKPELEIFADDVKCSHGAASGELDEMQLFYMQSRGIGLEEAKQILIDAYLDDVVAKISNQTIREWFKNAVRE